MADRGIGPGILNRHPLPYIPGYQGQPSRGFQDVYLGLPMEPNQPPKLEACAALRSMIMGRRFDADQIIHLDTPAPSLRADPPAA